MVPFKIRMTPRDTLKNIVQTKIKFCNNPYNSNDVFFDAKSELEAADERHYFETSEYEQPGYQLNLIQSTTHVTNTL